MGVCNHCHIEGFVADLVIKVMAQFNIQQNMSAVHVQTEQGL